MLIGHEEISDYFKKVIDAAALGHAYCFVGPDGVGKRTLARGLAAQLLNFPEDKLETNPDFHFLKRQEDEKSGKLKKDISISQTRDLRAKLHHRSWLGGYQIVIVDEAELLNTASSSSILKILEEPPEKIVLFILTNDVTALPATVLSRCEIFYFSLVKTGTIIKGLVDRGVAKEEALNLAAAAWGRPGRAINFWNDASALEEYRAETRRFEKMARQSFHERIGELEEIIGEKTDAIRDREKLRGILDIWIALCQKTLLAAVGAENKPSASPSRSTLQIVEVIDGLNRAKKFLGENIHPRLLLEQSLLNF